MASETSEAVIRDGYLILSYDGTNVITMNSNFTFTANFEASVEIRQALDPVFFSVYNDTNTVTFKYNDGTYSGSLSSGDSTNSCWSNLASAEINNQFFTDYLCVTSQDIQNKYIQPTHIIRDTCEVALNVIGGPPQDRGNDFIAVSDKISWDGLNFEGQVKAGDLLRVVYLAQDLSGPVPIRIAVEDNTVSIIESKDNTLFKKMIYDTGGQWHASFSMNTLEHTLTESADCTNASHGMGYFSKFLVISDSISNTSLARPYSQKIQRQPIIIHEGS